MDRQFQDRAEAGKLLAAYLLGYANKPDLLVLALPRGGVPVAFEVATALGAPLDVFVVRKLGVPGQEELAMGAIASGGVRVLNHEVVRSLQIPRQVIDTVTADEQRELRRRELLYRGKRPALDVHGRTVIVVDDGLATGATMRAAIAALQAYRPGQIVVAVPVAELLSCRALAEQIGEVACLMTPQPLQAIGLWYVDFSQTTDDQVCELLARAARNDNN
ncbi:MAG: phosphoribosyltransferase [Gemmatimonadaceae bacterium]|nr:phosphoribosyltransferase [Gloeobacterales cyanobacterium ES-bin-141]